MAWRCCFATFGSRGSRNGAAGTTHPKIDGGPMAGGRVIWTPADLTSPGTTTSGSTKLTMRAGTTTGVVASWARAPGQQVPGQVQLWP